MKNIAPNSANISSTTSATPADRDAEWNSRSGSSADRDVHVEAGFPADVLHQQAAYDRPGGGGRADDRAPDADGPVQLFGRERVAQQGQRGRLQHRSEHALQRPERDDQAEAAG